MTISGAIKSVFMVGALLAVLAQIAIDPSLDNTICACIIFASSMAILLYMSWTTVLRDHPISVFAIFGFCLNSQLGALLAQTLAWTPVSRLLYDPIHTFATLALYQGIAIAVHAVYSQFSSPQDSGKGLMRDLISKLGVYKTPSAASLWVLGCIGLPSLVLSHSASASGSGDSEGALGHAFAPLSYLMWAPFLIPFFRHQRGDDYSSRRSTWWLAFYAAVIALAGVALSARALMFIGALTIFTILLLNSFRSDKPVTGSLVVKLAGAVLVASLLMPPLSKLVLAMAVARANAGKVTAAQMVTGTIHVLQNPYLIEAYEASKSGPTFASAYDERYTANPLMSKFVETKFHDNAFHFGSEVAKSDSGKEQLLQMTYKSFWAALPTPILHILKVDVDKSTVSFSLGDYLVYLSRGGALGSRRTGSAIAQGLAIAGPLFPLFFGLICFVEIYLMELITVRSAAGVATGSALALMNIWQFFNHGFSGDSLQWVFVGIVRNFPTMVIVYWIAMGFAGLVVRQKYAPELAEPSETRPSTNG